jgi:hypothetical protein
MVYLTFLEIKNSNILTTPNDKDNELIPLVEINIIDDIKEVNDNVKNRFFITYIFKMNIIKK